MAMAGELIEPAQRVAIPSGAGNRYLGSYYAATTVVKSSARFKIPRNWSGGWCALRYQQRYGHAIGPISAGADEEVVVFVTCLMAAPGIADGNSETICETLRNCRLSMMWDRSPESLFQSTERRNSLRAPARSGISVWRVPCSQMRPYRKSKRDQILPGKSWHSCVTRHGQVMLLRQPANDGQHFRPMSCGPRADVGLSNNNTRGRMAENGRWRYKLATG